MTEFRYAPFFRIMSLLAVFAFWGLAFLGWMAYRVEQAVFGLVMLWPCLLVGLYWLAALAAAPHTVRFGPDHLTLHRWLGRRTLTYDSIRSISQSYALITIKAHTTTVRLHKLFVNDDAKLMRAFETHVPVAQQARAARLAQGLPIVLTGRKVAPVFTALSGLGLLAFGALAVGQAFTNSAGPDLAERVVIGGTGLLSMGLGGLFIYLVGWTYPHRVVFTAEALTQHFLTHTTTQSMREVVDFQPGYEIRSVRGLSRRVYTITFIYRNSERFKWIPDEFYFPMDYHEAVAANLAAELTERLQRAYVPATSP